MIKDGGTQGSQGIIIDDNFDLGNFHRVHITIATSTFLITDGKAIVSNFGTGEHWVQGEMESRINQKQDK